MTRSVARALQQCRCTEPTHSWGGTPAVFGVEDAVESTVAARGERVGGLSNYLFRQGFNDHA